MYYSYIDSPVGKLLVSGDQKGLRQISFPTGKNVSKPLKEWKRDDKQFVDVRKQLTAYFKGDLKKFHLKLSPEGTAFQKDVLNALQKIPYGKTKSYADIARLVGRPKACRAVGAANGRNPLSIVIPCHRVIGASGHLTGFGGGIATKKFLLDLEKKYSNLSNN